jgi:hypothetical protein
LTLKEAVPGEVVNVGDQLVVFTVAVESVTPPLVMLTRYDVALAAAFQLASTVKLPFW